MTALVLTMTFFMFERFFCQILRDFLRFLNFAVMAFALCCCPGVSSQFCYTVWLKEGCCNHVFSNLNIELLGMTVEMVMLQGQ